MNTLHIIKKAVAILLGVALLSLLVNVVFILTDSTPTHDWSKKESGFNTILYQLWNEDTAPDRGKIPLAIQPNALPSDLPLDSTHLRFVSNQSLATASVTMTPAFNLKDGLEDIVRNIEKKPDTHAACPKKPQNLLGEVKVAVDAITTEELVKKYPEVSMGGHLRPADCTARQKLAIIIPFRNRHSHLNVLLNNIIPFLRRQQADATFIVVEQAGTTTWNKGALYNAGFLEAEKMDNFQCYILHDVDLLPLNDHCMYRCGPNPRHFASAMNKFNYSLPYDSFFGGVVGFTREQYLLVNGNSNFYIGWGGEDDDILIRMNKKNMTMLRYDLQISKYDMFKHDRDKGNKENPFRFALLNSAARRMELDGVNTVKYQVVSRRREKLYTWISVHINNTEIMQTAPGYTRRELFQAKKNLQV